MRLRDLGTLSIEIDGAQSAPGGDRPATVLALLLIHANERVSVETVIDAVWGGRARQSAASTLESHVWRLRRVLEPERAAREAPRVLINQAGGYRLLVGAHEVDSLRFGQLAQDVLDLSATGQLERALRRCDDALGLWRGRPFEPCADREWAAAAVARLEEQRRQVQERRIDLLLETGEAQHAVLDVEPLIREMPFRERFRAQHMLALYRCGRADDALRAFQAARTALLDEIGLEPGPGLQDLQRQILAQEPGLGHAAPIRRDAAPVEIRLPGRTSPILGRDEDIAELERVIAGHRLVSLAGPAGAGKTRLAIEVAARSAARYPDGVWFADLASVSDPALIITTLMSTIDLQPPSAGTAVAALQAHVRQRQMLLVLDNCEHLLPALAEVAAGLIDGDAEITVLTTTREPLGIAGERVHAVGPLTVPDPSSGPGQLGADPVIALFLARAGAAAPDRVAAAPDEQSLLLARRICAAVDGLPLAIELAAARARAYSLEEIAAQVEDDPSRLASLRSGGRDRRQSLRAALDWSVGTLSDDERSMHVQLSMLPGPFTAAAAAGVIDPASEADAADLLPALVNRSLLASAPANGGRSLFRQLTTVRSHAARSLGAGPAAAAALGRRDEWVRQLAERAPAFGSFAEGAWFAEIDDDYATVRATLGRTLGGHAGAPGQGADPAVGIRVVHRLSMYWYYRSQLAESGEWVGQAIQALPSAARLSTGDQVLVRLVMASLSSLRGRSDLARPDIEQAIELLPTVAPDQMLDVASQLGRVATSVWSTDDLPLMVQVSDQLAAVAGSLGEPRLDVFAQAIQCLIDIAQQGAAAGAERSEEVYDRAIERDHAFAAWTAAGARTVVALLQRDPEDGMRWSDRVIDIHRRLGTRQGGWYLETRANFACLAASGAPGYEQAAALYAAARTHNRRGGIHWPRRAVTLDLQAQALAQLGEDGFARAWRIGERWTLADIVALSRGAGVEALLERPAAP